MLDIVTLCRRLGMARSSSTSLLEQIDSKMDFPFRRAVCYKCGIAYNGYKRSVKCPKCKALLITEAKSRQTFVTGSWVKLSEFNSDV
jgi:hypothetical protein